MASTGLGYGQAILLSFGVAAWGRAIDQGSLILRLQRRYQQDQLALSQCDLCTSSPQPSARSTWHTQQCMGSVSEFLFHPLFMEHFTLVGSTIAN